MLAALFDVINLSVASRRTLTVAVIFRKEGLKLPKEISPCPIVEAICEVRFEPTVHPDAVFGACYAKLSPLIGPPTNLPILGLPPEIREGDPNLRFQPHYKFTREGYTFQLGPRVLALSVARPYPGWQNFSAKVKTAVKALNETSVIADVKRFGLRYIDYFEGNVFDLIDVEIQVNSQALAARETALSLVTDHRYSHVVRIRKDVTVGVANKTLQGSVIDVDSFAPDPKGGLSSFDQFLEEAHEDEKTIFFGMLKPEFLATLHPNYEY